MTSILFLNQKNLLEPIRMQLSKKQNSFSQFFAPFFMPNTAEICTLALLSYIFITLREIEFENISS